MTEGLLTHEVMCAYHGLCQWTTRVYNVQSW